MINEVKVTIIAIGKSMKQLMVFIYTLVIIGCCPQKPKIVFPFPYLKFGTRVVVVNGFYEGQTGTVVDYTENYSTACSRGYKVKLDSSLIKTPQFVCNGGLSVIKEEKVGIR